MDFVFIFVAVLTLRPIGAFQKCLEGQKRGWKFGSFVEGLQEVVPHLESMQINLNFCKHSDETNTKKIVSTLNMRRLFILTTGITNFDISSL